jgi:hypothetical protein
MAALASPDPRHFAASDSAGEGLRAERRTAFEALKAELNAKASLPSLPVEGSVATSIPELDRLLEGGFPPGAVATLEGTIGRWSVAAGLVAATTRRSLVAILDDGTLYPPSLAEAGVRLERVLVVPARKALEAARAVDILLRSRICRLVLMPAIALRDAVWTRLATLAHRSGVLLIVMAAHAGVALSAAAELRLHCTLERIVMHGTRGLWGRFAGFELCVGLRKHKRMLSGRTIHLAVGRSPRAALR